MTSSLSPVTYQALREGERKERGETRGGEGEERGEEDTREGGQNGRGREERRGRERREKEGRGEGEVVSGYFLLSLCAH